MVISLLLSIRLRSLLLASSITWPVALSTNPTSTLSQICASTVPLAWTSAWDNRPAFSVPTTSPSTWSTLSANLPATARKSSTPVPTAANLCLLRSPPAYVLSMPPSGMLPLSPVTLALPVPLFTISAIAAVAFALWTQLMMPFWASVFPPALMVPTSNLRLVPAFHCPIVLLAGSGTIQHILANWCALMVHFTAMSLELASWFILSIAQPSNLFGTLSVSTARSVLRTLQSGTPLFQHAILALLKTQSSTIQPSLVDLYSATELQLGTLTFFGASPWTIHVLWWMRDGTSTWVLVWWCASQIIPTILKTTHVNASHLLLYTILLHWGVKSLLVLLVPSGTPTSIGVSPWMAIAPSNRSTTSQLEDASPCAQPTSLTTMLRPLATALLLFLSTTAPMPVATLHLVGMDQSGIPTCWDALLSKETAQPGKPTTSPLSFASICATIRPPTLLPTTVAHVHPRLPFSTTPIDTVSNQSAQLAISGIYTSWSVFRWTSPVQVGRSTTSSKESA